MILWIFLSWGVCVTAVDGLTVQGVQNLACYFLFLSSALIVSHRVKEQGADRFIKFVVVVGWLRAGLYAVDLARFGFEAHGVYAARAFGIQAVVIMAAVIPFGRYVPGARLLPYVLAVETALSGSRTAMAVAGVLLAMIPMCCARRVRRVRAVVRLAAVGTGGYLAVTCIPVLHDRFFGGDVVMFQGAEVNSSGRDLLWSVVSDHARTRPWTGFGAGSATRIVREVVVTSGEPHNDYLRLWHDFGYIGLGLWITGYVALMVGCGWRIRRSSGRESALHYGALFALLGVGIIMITDNVVIYYYAVLPLGVLVGLSHAGLRSVDERPSAVDEARSRPFPPAPQGEPRGDKKKARSQPAVV